MNFFLIITIRHLNELIVNVCLFRFKNNNQVYLNWAVVVAFKNDVQGKVLDGHRKAQKSAFIGESKVCDFFVNLLFETCFFH